MIINNNIGAMNAHRQMGSNQEAQQNSMEKLSSGQRINRAGDDAAGLAISEKMRGQIRGLEQASRNSQDGISLIQTAEGALNETQSILQRIRELTVQAGNEGTQESEDLDAIQDEITSLVEEIGGTGDSDGISDRTEFNGKSLLDGSFDEETADLTFQIGSNQGQQLEINIENMAADALGSVDEDEGTDVGTKISDINVADFEDTDSDAVGGFDEQLQAVDDAINQVSAQRSALGAVQNRLDHSINNLETSGENLQASESRIRDVDMAKEMMNNTKNNILSQASQSMLAQANQQPQSVLQLLQ